MEEAEEEIKLEEQNEHESEPDVQQHVDEVVVQI